MSVDSIIVKINEKGRKEEKAYRQKEKERAQNVKKRIFDKSVKQVNDIMNKAKEEADDIQKKEQLLANLLVRKNTLAKKQELIDEAFTRSLQQLQQLDGQKWAQFIKHIIKEQTIEGSVSLLVPKKDKEKYKRYFSLTNKNGKEYFSDISDELTKETGQPYQLYLSEENATFSGGCIIQGETYDIDVSFEALLRDVRERYEREVYDILFELGEGNG